MSNQTSQGSSLIVQGRIVWTCGDLFSGQVKKDQNKQVVIDQRTGEPVIEYGFGLAIKKVGDDGQHHPEYVKAWKAMQTEAQSIYQGGQVPPNFAWKYKDGDSAIDDKGQPYANRTGYAGHFVLTCTTRIPIKYFIFQGGNNTLVNTGIKCGDYVNVQLNLKAHPAQGTYKAGLYVNPMAVQLIAAGAEIINTPSGDDIFGTQAAPTYQGQMEAPAAAPMPQVETAAPAMPQQPAAPAMPQMP